MDDKRFTSLLVKNYREFVETISTDNGHEDDSFARYLRHSIIDLLGTTLNAQTMEGKSKFL